MAVETREIKSSAEYEPLILQKESPFTQGFNYGSWQEKMGRRVIRISFSRGQEVVALIQLVKYPLVRGYSYLYAAHGPILKSNFDGELAEALHQALLELCKKEKAAFARIDPFPPLGDMHMASSRFTRSSLASYYSAYFQSPYDWVLNITPDEQTLLKEMHYKTRYSIVLSQKKGVEYETASGEGMMKYFEDFYRLMVETAERGKFSLHPKRYYQVIFESAATDPSIVLYIAKYQGTILATHLIIFYGETAYYPFGASTDKERNRMPTYGLHWNAIRDAKAQGCQWYNFGATEANQSLTHKNWQGITEFKRKFGGKHLDYSPFYDVVAHPLIYRLYDLRKKLKRFI